MGVSTTTNRVSFTGNGVTTAFSFPYKFLLEEDLVVVLREIATGIETVKTIVTHYTVTGEGEDAGGTVTMLSAPSALYQLVIYNDPDQTQEVNLEENDSSPAEVQEGALDKLTLLVQRLSNRISRAVRLSDGFAPSFDPTLPVDLDASADKIPIVNSSGTGWADASEWPSAGDIDAAEENAAAAAASASAALASETAAGISEAAAAVSAAAAQTAVDSIIWRDVVFKTFADSPYTITDADRGKLFVVDTSGGAFTFNLPSIAALTLTDPWSVGVKKSTGDTNAVTIARNGTDTIDGGTSATLSVLGSGLVFIPDTDPSPDEWTTQAFGISVNPMTTAGDIIYGGASGVPTRLANGTAGQGLRSGGGALAPGWFTPMPTIQRLTSGSGTYNKNYTFVITSGSATVGATYTNNGVTYTVYATVASATQVVMSGSGAPTASGTLTKASGTGDSTLTFAFVVAPAYLKIRMVGGGGGGGASGTLNTGTAGGDGGDTTFGSSLLTAAKGLGGGRSNTSNTIGGAGGAVTVNSPAIDINSFAGQQGSAAGTTVNGIWFSGGKGGITPFIGSGVMSTNQVPPDARANSGSGGDGGGGGGAGSSVFSGCGGGAGGYIEALIPNPSATYAYAIGAGGANGTIGTNGEPGADGGSGLIIVEEFY